MSIILHIIPRDAWQQAQATGEYAPESLEREGFIHFSTAEQAERVANNFYAGQRGLVLLVVDTDHLTSRLEWEPPVHPQGMTVETPMPDEEKFPHLYGALNVDAVVRMVDFEPGEDGLFHLPENLA